MNDRNAKERIIQTSIRMIQEKDYNKITTNHIARKSGVSIGTLYYHFENGKPDIIKEIVKQGYAEFLDEINLRNLTLEKLPGFLKNFLKRYLKQHEQNKAFLVAVEMAFLSNRKIFQDYEYIQSELKLIPLISNVLKQLEYPDKENLDDVSKFLLYSIDSIIHRHVICEDLLIGEEELIRYLSEMILRFIKFSGT
jgi:AcrR family transcriptional regulator